MMSQNPIFENQWLPITALYASLLHHEKSIIPKSMHVIMIRTMHWHQFIVAYAIKSIHTVIEWPKPCRISKIIIWMMHTITSPTMIPFKYLRILPERPWSRMCAILGCGQHMLQHIAIILIFKNSVRNYLIYYNFNKFNRLKSKIR